MRFGQVRTNAALIAAARTGRGGRYYRMHRLDGRDAAPMPEVTTSQAPPRLAGEALFAQTIRRASYAKATKRLGFLRHKAPQTPMRLLPMRPHWFRADRSGEAQARLSRRRNPHP